MHLSLNSDINLHLFTRGKDAEQKAAIVHSLAITLASEAKDAEHAQALQNEAKNMLSMAPVFSAAASISVKNPNVMLHITYLWCFLYSHVIYLS